MVSFKTKDGKQIDLTFTRRTALIAEKKGLNVTGDVFETMPMNSIEILFTTAFEANHSNLSNDKRLDIIESLGNKEGLITALITEFANAYNTLMSEPDEKNAVKWEVTE